MTATAPRQTAAAAFAAQVEAFDALTDQLEALRAANFGTDDASLNWADVGSLAELTRQLREAVRFATGTAE